MYFTLPIRLQWQSEKVCEVILFISGCEIFQYIIKDVLNMVSAPLVYFACAITRLSLQKSSLPTRPHQIMRVISKKAARRVRHIRVSATARSSSLYAFSALYLITETVIPRAISMATQP